MYIQGERKVEYLDQSVWLVSVFTVTEESMGHRNTNGDDTYTIAPKGMRTIVW